MMIVTAPAYCVADALRALSLCEDPVALPLGDPITTTTTTTNNNPPAVGPRVALWSLGLLWLQGGA